jgi:hypothetical protein
MKGNIMRTFFKFKIVLFASLLVISRGYAATDGTLGTTSTGFVTVSITIPALVQISGLADITLNSVTTLPVTGSTQACIYSNVVTPSLGSYIVTASSTNASGTNFRVKDSAGPNFIVYSAFWNNTSAATPTTALSSGTSTTRQSGGSATSVTCGGGKNANFNISFSPDQVESAAATTYTDVVQIIISP